MKLRTGKDTYKLPPYDRVYHVLLETDGFRRNVAHMAIEVVFACKKVRGIPDKFCTMDDKIIFHPAPDKPYKVTVRYTPPMMEA